ncbi:MAG: thiamine diphosphokinase [Bacillota bacterium]
MRAVIIANGSIDYGHNFRDTILHHDLIICADGGAKYLKKINVTPHIIVGDLDSIDQSSKEYYLQKGVELYQFPTKKNHTDTDLAVQYAISKGCKEITFLGAIGSRMDHTLANIMLLIPLVQTGIKARILNETNDITVINQDLEVQGDDKTYMSLIPITQTVEGVTLEGFEYPLVDATLRMGDTIGISNQFQNKQAFIRIKKGLLLVIKAIE